MSTYNKYRPKIVCIGLNKSGTTSFKDSLKQCGLKPFNEVFGHQYLLADIEHRNIHSTLSLLEYPRYDFYEDMPFSLLNVYKNLYIHRPQDYYVLTLRDTTEQWVESAYRYYVNSLDTINLNKDNKPYDIFYHGRGIPNRTRNYLTAQMRNWGINSNVNLKENLKDVYNRHVDDVFDYFDNKIDSNFISINVSKENELKKLSNFVGFETKENNFVWSNKSKK
jgi:hypothetical protein